MPSLICITLAAAIGMSAAGSHHQGGTAGAGEAPSNARRGTHIGRACDTCRRRHVKCDGAERQCVQCVITHNRCERTGTDHRRGQHAADIAQLQARITELEIKLEAKTAELETKTADFGERAAALETSHQQLICEVTMLKLSMGVQHVSLTVSDESDASTPFTPFSSSSVPSSQQGSPDPSRFLRPIAAHGNEHLPVPYDRSRRRHRRALSERSVSRSGIPSTSSSAVPSPHIPALVIEPEPSGGWNATVASLASAGAVPAFPPAAVGGPNASGYTHAYPAGGTPIGPVGGENAADDSILFAAWMGGVSEVTSGPGPCSTTWTCC